jgi:hypothetical protein
MSSVTKEVKLGNYMPAYIQQSLQKSNHTSEFAGSHPISALHKTPVRTETERDNQWLTNIILIS